MTLYFHGIEFEIVIHTDSPLKLANGSNVLEIPILTIHDQWGLGGVAVGLLPAVVWVPGSIPGPAGAS